jgi:hypothetical protein
LPTAVRCVPGRLDAAVDKNRRAQRAANVKHAVVAGDGGYAHDELGWIDRLRLACASG